MRIQDEHIDIVQPAKRLYRRGPGIARGRAHDGHPVPRPFQRRLEQLPDQLHREILEGQRRPVEQFQQEMVGGKLLQRCAGRVVEPRISARDDAAKFVIGEGGANERAHDKIRLFLIA